MNRKCGSCSLCCRLLPVHDNEISPPMHKGANERCRHQFSGGCRVYHRQGFPFACALWSCRWLSDPRTEKLHRPDRSHYVIDVMDDAIVVQNNQTGEQQTVLAIQVWIDPAFPDAWDDAALFAYAKALNQPILLRYSSTKADVVMPHGTSLVKADSTRVKRDEAMDDYAGIRQAS